jgi:DNA-binding GntR family transcriptional regulator
MNAPARPRAQRRRGVRREQLSDEVAAHLRADIMTGTLRPGTFIRLDETAAALGVSITPVREALRTLRGEGMVQLEPHRGHVVVPLTRGDIEDIFWL